MLDFSPQDKLLLDLEKSIFHLKSTKMRVVQIFKFQDKLHFMNFNFFVKMTRFKILINKNIRLKNVK